MNKHLDGTVHKLPADLYRALLSDKQAFDCWQSLTPLARNEFICWVESAKTDKTRDRRINRTIDELNNGQRRPCCWIGCIHRTDKQVSPSVKAIINKNASKKTS